MMSEMSEITGSRCGATRQICRSLRYSAISLSLKYRLALLDKRLRRFLVIGGVAPPRMGEPFRLQTGLPRQPLRGCYGAADIAPRHPRPPRPRAPHLRRPRVQ